MSDDHPQTMIAPKEIAERLGLSRPAVTKAIKKVLLEQPDVPVERDSRDRIIKISQAHFEHHRRQYLNPAKAKPQPTPDAGATESFDEARRQSAWLNVERERVRQRVEMGQLLRADKIGEAVEQCCREIQVRVDRIANAADDLALAVSKEGAHGLRQELRRLAGVINGDIADILEQIVSDAPETDPMLTDPDT